MWFDFTYNNEQNNAKWHKLYFEVFFTNALVDLLSAPPGCLLVWADLQQNNKTSNCLFVLWEGGVEPIQSRHHRSQREANTRTHHVNLAPPMVLFQLYCSAGMTCWPAGSVLCTEKQTDSYLSFTSRGLRENNWSDHRNKMKY